MKRSLLILFISLLIVPLIAAAQSSYDAGTDPITAGLLGTFDTAGSFDISPTEWFKRTVGLEGSPKNLYLLMYTEVKAKPAKLTVKRVLDKHSLTDEEKQALLGGKDISLFQGKYFVDTLAGYVAFPFREDQAALGTTGTDQEALRNAQTAVRREFDLESELARMETEVEAEVTATEIFANGDTSDSGFDLLYDLNIIHLILFGEPTTLFGNTGAGGPAGGRKVNIEDIIDQQRKDKDDAAANGGGDGAGGGGNGGLGGDAGLGGAGNGDNALACFADKSLENALRKFDADSEAQNRAGANGGAGAGAGGGLDDAGAGAGGGGAGAGAGGNQKEDIQAEPSANWKRPQLCNENFCVEVDLVNKTESAKSPTANCIACHVEKINDAYRKTVQSNLVPSKATGNLLEIPLCKKGYNLGDFLNFNIITIPSPILTPSNDDIIIKHGLLDEMEAFTKKYFGDPERTVSGRRKTVDAPVPEIIQQAEQRALSQTSDRSNVNDVIRDINAEVAAKRSQALATLTQYKVLARAEDYGTGYQVLMVELNTMLTYFNTYKGLYKQIETPCKRLLDEKAYCQ